MQAPCTNQANNSLKLITKMWLTQPLLYTPISVQVLKNTRDNIPFYVYILSVSVKWIWGLKNMTEQCCIIKRVMAKDWKNPRQMLFFYIPESSDNTQTSLCSTIPLTKLRQDQRDYCPGCVTSCFWRWHPISNQDHQILPPCCKSSSN